MSRFAYFTNRMLKNDAGDVVGNILVVVMKDSDTAEVDYKCPSCSFGEKAKKLWKKPFSINCRKCGFLIKVPSLRSETKKGRKTQS